MPAGGFSSRMIGTGSGSGTGRETVRSSSIMMGVLGGIVAGEIFMVGGAGSRSLVPIVGEGSEGEALLVEVSFTY